NCFACHTASKLGGLQVDSRELLLKGGKRGPAVVPGDPEASLLIRAVTHSDPAIKMPMGGKLKDQEIADLKAWIAMGAPWPEGAIPPNSAPGKKGFVLTPEQRAFWSFLPIRKTPPPNVKDKGWAKSPIDTF